MRKLFVLLAALGLLGLLAASCETLNIGGGHLPQRFSITGVTLSPTAPAGGYVAGTAVTATINFQGVTAPFNFTLSFPNGGATPASQNVVGTLIGTTGAGTATANFTIDPFLLIDDADGKDIAFKVTGSDGAGSTGEVNGTFKVVGIPNQNPVIDSAFFNAGTNTVTVTAHDDDGDDITITPSNVPAGLTTGGAQTISGGSGTVDFVFSANDPIAGGSGTITFTADDGNGGTDTETADVNIAAFPLADNTLYAIPSQTTVAVGAPVTITVYTGKLPNPFQYATGIRVTFPTTAGGDYVDDSFNVGVPGGDPDHPDGIWATMDLEDGDFLLATDSFYKVTTDAADGDPLIEALDFNVTPLDGNDLTDASGAICNFQMNFANAGAVPLRFQQFFTVNRTYYQDGNQNPDYFWGDITNDHPGVTTTITVQ